MALISLHFLGDSAGEAGGGLTAVVVKGWRAQGIQLNVTPADVTAYAASRGLASSRSLRTWDKAKLTDGRLC
jgi:hypothetical protein